MIELACGFVHLLPQGVESCQNAPARVVRIEIDIVADTVGGKETIDRACVDQLFRDDLPQQFLCIIE